MSSSRFMNPLQRAETQNTSNSRLRSNSSPLKEEEEGEHVIEHAVEPRAATAMLPPVMVCLLHADFDLSLMIVHEIPKRAW